MKCVSRPSVFSLWILLGALLGLVPAARAVNLVQEFYLPMPEQQIYQANTAIISGTGSTLASTFSIVVTGSGTVIYYDQWEDGYETDLSNPTQSTTQIWGDGNDAHGIPPGFAHNPLGIPAGTVITLTNNVSLPRNPSTVLWDGRDRIAANKALIISRAAWPIPTGPVFAGAASVLSTMDYGTNYISPVGQNLTNNLFKYVGMFIMAAQNNTVVTIDPNGTGVGTTNIVLNQGESYLVNGGIKTGGRVTATKPVQADLIIGHVGASYASDWFTLYPASAWSSSYYTPVGSAAKVSQPAYVYLYNPGGTAITINYQTQVGSGSFSVPGTNGVYQFQMPVGSGASFMSAGGQSFYALCTVAANNASDTSYNWGFTLVPQAALTTEATVGWGPGSADGTVDGSPAWVTALAGTKLYVDYKGDHTGPLTDPNGNQYDTNFTVTALQSQKIFAPSKDQTGMRIYTVDGTLITAAWGEDPDTAQSGNPYIDAGTTVLPFPVPVVKKFAALTNDVAPAGLSIGDTIQYTVQVDNKGLLALGNTVVIDAPSGNLTYVPSSTTFDGSPIPDNVSGNPFPLAAPGYTIPIILSQGTSTFQYRALVNASGTISNSVNIGGTTISANAFLAPPPTNGASVNLVFTDTSGAATPFYAVGANVFVTMTNAVGNTSSSSAQTISVTVVDTNTLDLQTITLTETGNNTGIFRNVAGLPTSASSGLGQQDGILNVAPGDTLSVSYTDPNFGDSGSATALISFPTPSKQLYLTANGVNGNQFLNRVNPVATAGHGTNYASVDIGSGSGALTVAATTTATNATGGTSMTMSNVTVASGASQMLLVGVTFNPGSTISSIKYGAQSLTLVTGVGDGTYERAEIWRLLSPPVGTTNVVITFASSASDISAGTMVLNGVNQTTPFSATNTASGNGTTPSVTISSVAGNQVFNLVASRSGTSATATGSGQVKYWGFVSGGTSLGAASLAPGAASVTSSWTMPSGTYWSSAAISINPAAGGGGGPATNVTAFAQTPAFASPFTLPAGGTVTITNFIALTNGTLSSGAAITATLQANGTNFLTLTSPVYSSVNSNLVWSGVLPASVTIPTGAAITYFISNGAAGTAFHVNYDSTNTPSVIVLPASAATVIQMNAFGIYDAPYPNGNLVNSPVAGTTLYIRANATDPFGSYDITSLGLVVTGPDAGSSFTNTLTGANVVATNSNSKTYEFPWTTGPTTGGYSIAATANEGTEGITAVATASLTTTFLDLGTPSTTVFTSGANGSVTNSYAANGVVSVRVSDLNRNTNATTIDTVSVTVTSSAGDSEVLTLIETGVNTGVFTNSISASATVAGSANNGTLYAPVGSILTASYSDPTDPTDNTSATATVQPAPGIPGVKLTKTILSPSGGQVGVNQPVTYNLQVVNTGSTVLTNVSVTDNFPSAKLVYANASPAPSVIGSGVLTWNALGSFAPGQSTNLAVTFTTTGATGVVTNSATVNGGTATNTSAVTLLVNQAALNVVKILLTPTNTPVAVGSNVVFRITVQNVGNTVVNYLPLEDNFSGANYQFVSSTVTNNGSGAGSLIWTNLAYPIALATNAVITNDVTMKVVGQGSPANNTAVVDFATDIFGNPVPASSSTIGVNTASAAINGHVYNDVNQSGVFTNGDTGLGGVALQLFTDPNGDGNPSDGTLVQLTTTDVNGYYELLNLGLGHYVVVATPLPGYISSAPANNRIALNLTTLTASASNNFFQYVPAASVYSTLSGTVWYDTNGNGTNNVGETNLANVEIDLVSDVNSNGLADAGEPVTASAITDASGNYSFAAVTPGRYVIREVDPYGYYSTGDSQSPNNNQISFVSTNGIVSTNNNFFDRLSPVAVADNGAALYFVSTILSPLTNDISPNGDVLTITNATSTNGIVVINPGSTNLTFTPTNLGPAVINYTIADAHGGTSTAVITETVTALADLAAGKTAAAFVVASNNLVYTISVTNFGPTPASLVVVTDALPATAAFVNASGGGVNNSGVVVWNLGTLANGQVSNVTVTVSAPASGTLTNAASVSSPVADPNPTNNLTPPVTTTVTAAADVAVGKSGPAGSVYGTNYSYTISVTNFGPSTATALSVTDNLPAKLIFVSALPAATTNAGNQVIWPNLGSLAVGATTNLTLTVRPATSGAVSNTASVGSPTQDPNLTNNLTPPVITTISQAPAAVTWPTPTNIVYGTPLGTNQNNATSSVPGTYGYNPTNGTVLNVGTNTLTVVYTPTDTNYATTNLSVQLVVTPAPLSVTASNASRQYGQTNPVFGGTIVGLQNSDNIMATYATTATSGSPAGNYPIVPTLADPNSRLANYNVTTNNGTLSVGQVLLGITANATNRYYGATNPVFTFTASGFVNGDTTSVLLGSPSLTTLATTNSPAGNYVIVATNGTLSATNYSFSFTNSLLTVKLSAPSVVWPVPTNIVYGTPLGTNQNTATSSVPGTYVYNPTNGVVLPVGTNTLTVVYTPTDTNYGSTNLSVSLVVTPAPLTVTANNQGKIYGQTLTLGAGQTTFTSGGLFGGDTVTSVTLASAGAPGGATVGSYPLVPSAAAGSGLNNYSITYSNGTLTVSRGQPAVTWPVPTNIVYGTPLGTNQNAATSPVPGTYIYNPTNGTVLLVGTNTLTVAYTPTDTNYAATNLNVPLVVTPATLGITANPTNRYYGATNPVFTFTASGFVNGDTTSVLIGSPSLTTTAVTNSPAGGYTIVATNGTLTATNYVFNFTNGLLTVKLVAPLVVWPVPTNIIYGTPLGMNQNNATSSVPGTYGYNPTNGTVLPVGTNTLTVIYTPTDTNYGSTNLSVQLIVTPAPLSVTASNASRQYGQTNPVFGGSLIGVVNADNITATYATLATSGSPAGNYPIVPTLLDPNSRLGNYSVTTNNGTLSVGQALLGITANATNRYYGTTNPVFTFTASGFVNGDNGSVLLGSPSLTTLATTNSPVGTYVIVATNGTLSATNYSFNFTNSLLTVQLAGPSVVWPVPTNIVYGTPLGTNQNNATSTVPGSYTYDPTNGTVLLVGTNTLTVVYTPTDTNYASTNLTQLLVVTPAPLTVTANNQGKVYGQTLTLGAGQTSFTSSGLLNGDTVTSVTLASLGASSGAPAGSYPLTPSLAAGSGLTNYSISYSNGTLTVAFSTPLVTWPVPGSIVYGTPLSVLQNNATSTVPGTAVYNPTNGTVLNVGTNTLTVVYTPTDTNYATTNLSVQLVVTPAPLSVTASNASRQYGQTNPVFGGTIVGLQNSDNIMATYATTATSGSPAGNYPIVPTLADPNSRLANYNVTTNNGTLSVGQVLLGITANATNRYYGATNPVFTFTASGFVNGDTTSVLLGSPSLTTLATTNSPAGNYVIVATNGTLSATNYSFSFTNSLLTVKLSAPSVVWPVPTNIVYGTPLGTNQNTATSSVPGTYVYNPTNGVVLPVGTNTLTVVYTPTDTNYGSTNLSVSLVVTPAPLTVTANNQGKIYGQTLTLGAGQTTFTSGGLFGGDTVTSVTLASAGAPGGATVGSYPLVPSAAAGSGLNNYSITYSNGTLTVSRGQPAVTWPVPTNIVYGTPLGTNQNAATSPVPGTYIYNPTNGTVLLVGTNTLTVAYTPTDTNYAATNLNVPLVVTPATLGITANPTNRYYGATNPVFTFTASGFVNGDTTSVLIGSPSLTTTAVTNSPAGGYTIVATNGTLTATNYVFNFTNGLLTVKLVAPLVVWPVPTNIIYGTPLGMNQNNATSSVPGTYGYNPTNGTVLPVGTNTLTVIYTPTDTNYGSTNLSVQLIVTPAPLSVTASNASRQYGQTNPVFGGSLIGVVNADNITATYATLATSGSPAGNYPIVPTLLDPNSRLGNYSVTTNNGTLSVGQALLGITANATNRYYGTTNPVFTFTASGFVNGDNGSVLLGSPSLTTLATTNSPVGTYVIVATNGTLSATNYSFNFTNSLLTVQLAGPSVVWPVPTNIVYGTPLGTNQNNATSTVPGSYTYDPTNGTVLLVGTNTLTVVYTPTDTNYASTNLSVQLLVTPAALSVTANNAARAYGQTNPVFGGSLIGLQNGDNITAAYVTTATTNSVAGTYPIVPTLVDPNELLANYSVTTNYGTLTVTNVMPTANAQSLTVSENVAKALTLTGSDPASLPLTFIIVSAPTHGALSLLDTNAGTVTYTPTHNFNGADSFTFVVNNGQLNSLPATVNLTVQPVADLVVNQAGPASGVIGSNVVFTVWVTNLGPATATNIVVTNQLASGFTFVSAASSGTNNGGAVVWKFNSLPVNGVTNFAVTVRLTAGGSFTNIASGGSDVLDLNLANNNGSAPTAQAGLSVTPLQFAWLAGPAVLNPQTGLFEESVVVTNTGFTTVAGVRLYVGGLRSGVTLRNATGTTNGTPYVEYDASLNPGGTVTFALEFYNVNRLAFTNTLTAVAIPFTSLPTSGSNGVAVTRAFMDTRIVGDPRFVIEFPTIIGKSYTVLYSTNLNAAVWNIATPAVTAAATVTQWYDDGPPKTISPPMSAGSRYYRVIQN